MKRRHAASLLLVLTACGRTDRPDPAASQTVVAIPVTSAWSWHPLGGLAVIEGEVGVPTELVLAGRSINERRFAETGPVRWEFFRPPVGEEAVLRTADGRELARFTFSLPKPPSRTEGGPRFARHAEPPPPKPTPEPPAPKVRAEARFQSSPVQAIPDRKAQTLPTPQTSAAAPRVGAWLRKFFLPDPTPSAPKVHAEIQPRNAPIPAIPSRPTRTMPSASVVPTDLQRNSAPVPVLVESEILHSTKPGPPPLSMIPPVGALPAPSALWPGMGEALNLTRGPGGQKRILLSFDGGSSAEVATEVLDLLKARHVHTTLFLTGAFIQRFPALVKRMAADGHELGNHTMDHPHFAPGMKRDPKWTRERIQRELLDADAALVRLLGRPMDPFWRAPYGEHTPEIRRWAEELGYRHVGWSEGADTLDWATPKDRRLYRSGEAIVQRLEQRLTHNGDGLIVLMHLGSARALGDRPTDGLGAFIDRAQKEGWTFVSAGTILRDLGKPVWDSHQRLALLNGLPIPIR
jgi:peptidoglycan/xylan/chitin deacetylase (PgdA/CDA1 family)